MKRLKAQSFHYSPNQEKYFDISATTESIEDSPSSQGQVGCSCASGRVICKQL